MLSCDDADVNATRPHNGRTALHLASFHGHLDIVKHLVEDGKADKFAYDLIGEVRSFFWNSSVLH